MTFWLFTIGLSTVIAGFLILVLRSTPTAHTGTEAEINFYKAQLTDIERDTARGGARGRGRCRAGAGACGVVAG